MAYSLCLGMLGVLVLLEEGSHAAAFFQDENF